MSAPVVSESGHRHGPGLADVAAAGGAEVLTAGADGKVARSTAGSGSGAVVLCENDRATPFNCLCASPDGGSIAVGDKLAYVKIYDARSGEFKSIATRFTLPVRTVDYNHDGSVLAAGGDAEGIKLITTKNSKVHLSLQSGPQVRDISFDPEGQFLASVSCSGAVQIWDTATGKAVFTDKKAAPVTDNTSTDRARPDWLPDGSLLGVPGTDGDVVLYERLSWTETGNLSGAHTKGINCVSFSPNGLYAITVGRDKKVVLWNVSRAEVIAEHELPVPATAAAWVPGANSAHMVTEDGDLVAWEGLVPEGLSPPHVSLDELDALADKEIDSKEDLGADEEEGAEEGDDIMEFIEEDEPETAAAAVSGAAVDQADLKRTIRSEVKRSVERFQKKAQASCQEPIQAGRFPGSGERGQREFLTYTLEGFVTACQEELGNSIEVGFHDANCMRRRMPVYTDFYGFHLASIGKSGTAYASHSTAENPSTIVYRPFEFWAPKSDWTVQLPSGEEAECLATGNGFVAVATSARLLRIFSTTGLQTALISLDGPPVALATSDYLLSFVYHAGTGMPGEAQLRFKVIDVPEKVMASEGLLPTGGAELVWLGFSEEGNLSAYGSDGVLRVRTDDFGGSWTPVWNISDERKGEEEYHIIGVARKELYCIVCNSGCLPQAHPKPVLSMLPFQLPVASVDPSVAKMESEFLANGLRLSTAQRLLVSMGSAAEAAVADCELEADRCALKLVQHAMKNGLLARSLELASSMNLLPSMEGALKLASHHHQSALAERISAVLEHRQQLGGGADTAVEDEEEEEDLDLEEDGLTGSEGHRGTDGAKPRSGSMDRSDSPGADEQRGTAVLSDVVNKAKRTITDPNPFSLKKSRSMPEPSAAPANPFLRRK